MPRLSLKNKSLIVFGIAIVLAAIALYAVRSVPSRSFEPFPQNALPGVAIGDYLPAGYGASGIVWHPRTQTFFVVSDGGIVSSMCEEGITFSHWRIGGDLEGVTLVCPQSDFIYIGNENSDKILEFNISTASITRSFDLTPWMDGPNNAGLEALTFVPNADDPEGGLFYAGLQDTGEIFMFRLPVRSSTTSVEVTHIATIPALDGVKDISGMYYKAAHDVIYAIYDSDNLMRALTVSGDVIGEWELPGEDQEGITLKNKELYIAQDIKDNSNIMRYAPFEGIRSAGGQSFELRE